MFMICQYLSKIMKKERNKQDSKSALNFVAKRSRARSVYPSHTPVAQKIADQGWLIANSAKNKYFFLYKMMWLKAG